MTRKTDDQAFDILKEAYILLRGEIGQSVAKQHQILLGGYSMIILIIGYAFGKDALSYDAAIVVPLVVLAMSSLWLVEANRMVRASNFLAFHVWDKFERLCDLPESLNWEKYCYRKGTRLQKRSCLNQYLGQMMVTVVMPLAISIFCMFQVFNNPLSKIVFAFGKTPFWIGCFIWLSIFLLMTYRISQVSNLASNDQQFAELTDEVSRVGRADANINGKSDPKTICG
jgi:hypothetical protein